MTIGAVLRREQLLAAAGIARSFKVARRDEVGEEVGRLLGRNLRRRDALFLHGAPHCGSVVPYQARHDRGAVIAIDPPGEIGRKRAAAAVEAMAADALLRPEQLLAAMGIAGNDIARKR